METTTQGTPTSFTQEHKTKLTELLNENPNYRPSNYYKPLGIQQKIVTMWLGQQRKKGLIPPSKNSATTLKNFSKRKLKNARKIIKNNKEADAKLVSTLSAADNIRLTLGRGKIFDITNIKHLSNITINEAATSVTLQYSL